MARRSLAKRLWYGYLHVTCRLAAVTLFRVRVEGRKHVPRFGGALVLSNHQSHFDPVIIGLASDRRLNYVARKTLFGLAPFRWLINSLDAIPIDRDGLGLDGLKTTLRRLRDGEMVLLFPEGTRTRDGEVGRLKPGFSVLVERTGVPIVPVAIEGSYDAWPRTRRFPRLSTLQIEFGPPISAEEAAKFDDRALVFEVGQRIRACHERARARLRRRRCAIRRDASA